MAKPVLLLFVLTGMFGLLNGPKSLLGQDPTHAARIIDRIDETHLVTLKGHMHPLANRTNDRGAAPESMLLDRIHLVLKRSDGQEAALKQLITEMHTPGSAIYHKWLTPDEFAKKFGPSDQDFSTIETWLTGHGFREIKVNPGAQTIEFGGNVAQMRSAFHTQIHRYEVNGRVHYANAEDPQIPAALSPVVAGFVSLNNFPIRSYARLLGKASYDPKTDKAKPQWTIGGGTAANGYSFVLAPQDYAVQYDLNPLYSAGINGIRQSIAIVNESNINIINVNLFRALFNLPQNPPSVIIAGTDPGIDGINNADGPNGASLEAYLDVEWAGAVAPHSTIDLVIAGDTPLESGLVLAAESAVYSDLAPVISLSFGSCELSLRNTNAFFNQLWEQAAAQGITVVVSSGDSGSAGCDNDNTQQYAVNGQAVNGFASTPYDVAVGGTDFYYSNYQNLTLTDLATYWNTTATNSTPATSIKGVIPEQPWNNSQFGLDAINLYALTGTTSIAAGGGGASNDALQVYVPGNIDLVPEGYPKPAWQTGTGVPNDGVRDLPDVSLFAANGLNLSYYPICADDGDCELVAGNQSVQISGVGGTSASAPAFAGIMALVNQQYGRQGQAGTVLYPLKAQFPSAFHDVTVGSNSVPCDLTHSTWDCIAVATPLTVNSVLEGQVGTGTAPEYNAASGYNLATGLGTIDANQLVTNWGKVTFASTSTTLNPSSTNFAHGTPITISGTVTNASGSPTGDVALMTDSTEPVQQGQTFFTLGNGSFSGTVSTLPGGTYNIWGRYGGDSKNGNSTSAKTQITVNPEASGVYFRMFNGKTSSGPGQLSFSPSYGLELMLSAMAVPSSQLAGIESCMSTGVACPINAGPTGTVTFKDNGTVINTAVINAEGDADYNVPLAVGPHSLTASYSGDDSYSPSASDAITLTVQKDTPFIMIGASNSTDIGQIITSQTTVFNVRVESSAQFTPYPSVYGIQTVPVAAPTGTVTVTGLPAGVPTTATLSPAVDPTADSVEGVATITAPANIPAGVYNLNISYSGDANYQATSNGIEVQVVSSAGLSSSTTASMSGSISPSSNVQITGTVTGQSGRAAPSGGVLIYSSGYYLGEVAVFPSSTSDVSNFSFVLNSQELFQGSNFVTLQYTGDATYNPSAFTLNGGSPISNPLSDFTIIPETAILPVTAGNTATEIVHLASVNGFNGTVGFSCTSDVGVTCSAGTMQSLSAGGSASTTLTVNAGTYAADRTYNLQIYATDTNLTHIHTAGVQAVVTGSVAGSQSFVLSSSVGILNVGAGATSGDTSVISVAPVGGFSGEVTLSCTVAGPSGATSPATCSVPDSVTLNGTTSQTATLTVNTTSATSLGNYTVTVTGTSGVIAPSVAVPVIVEASNFTITSAGDITVAAGSRVGNTSSVTITSTAGFSGTVDLTCVVTTSITNPNDPPTCSLAVPSVNITPTLSDTIVVTANTTATITGMNHPMNKLLWASAGGTVLAFGFFLAVPKRRRNWCSMLGLLLVFGFIGGLGCGGGNGGGGGIQTIQGTTAGKYTITVTGTSGTITRTATLTLTVN